MSMQVAPAQGQSLDAGAASSPAQVPGAHGDVQPGHAQAAENGAEDASSIPQALNVCCNGNYGVYLLDRRGVQCLCAACQVERAAKNAVWVKSPTEFERHSGMPTAKKWRMSIKVAHEGQPELPLGRWLELKGISQTRAQRVSTSPDRTHEQLALPHQQQQLQQQQHKQLQQHKSKPASGSSDSRDTTDAVRPCASSLARVLLQGLGRDQSGQVQGQGQGQLSRPNTPQRTSSSTQQQQLQESHRLSVEPPHFSSSGSGRGSIDVAAQLRSCFPTQQQQGASAAAAATVAAAAAARMETARVAAYAAAAAEAEAAAARAERHAGTAKQQQQQEQGSNVASPNAGRSSSSSQGGGVPRPSPPNLLHIPCPADAPPRPNDPLAPAAATYQGTDPVPLEEAAAAAARGDDSLWLRSPMCRTPGSARQQQGGGAGAGGSSRLVQQEAVAAEAFRRLISAHLHPKGAAAGGGVGGSARAAGQQGGGGLGGAAAAAAALLSSSLAGSRPSDAGSCSMDTLLAAAAAATAADAAAVAAAGGRGGNMRAAAAAAGAGPQGHRQGAEHGGVGPSAENADMDVDGAEGEGDDEEDEEAGIAVGPEHQADLPHLRPLPGYAAAVALVELRKSGLNGPGPEEALRLALEEKARSDLLPRDAVEDVWERAASGLALERAQRHRKPPGWQAGYVDPLKPLTAQQLQQQQQQALDAAAAAANGTPEPPGLIHNNNNNGEGPDSARHRKRGGSSNGGHQLDDALLLGSKKLRCNGSSVQPQHPSGLQASRFGPGAAAAAAARGRRVSLDGTPAGCCSEPGCPSNAPANAAPRVPPNGFAAPLRQPAFTAPVGPELLSWVLMVPPAATGGAPAVPSARPSAATADAAAAAAAGAEGVQRQQQCVGSDTAEQAPVTATVVAAHALDQQQQQQQEDAEMQDVAQAHPAVPAAGAAAAELPSNSSQPAALKAAAAAAALPETGVLAPEPPLLLQPTAMQPAAGLLDPSCLECQAAQGSAVEVRIVLDGCVFMGRLQEVSRLEMARSRVGAAVEPIKQVDVHRLPPPGAVCALCHAAEAPGAHMDQAHALRSCGLSSRGLGPLMPVCMPPLLAKQQAAAPAGANSSDQQQQQQNAAAAPAAAAAAAEQGAEQGAEQSEVAWVHRQCALWSPEVFPDRTGMLMHLPGAIRRGRATRCSHCGQKGATLKCAEHSCAQHFHLACARVAGCTLIPEPYAIGCPAHEPKLPEAPAAAALLSALPSSSNRLPLQDQQHKQQQQVPEHVHPSLPVLRCRTTRHRGPGDVAGAGGTPLAGSRADRDGGSSTPMGFAAGASPMHVDSCGLGGESEFVHSRAGSEDREGLDAQPGSGTGGGVAGYKRSRGGQSRLRRQTNTDWADAAFTARPDSPAHQDDATPTAAGAAAAAGRGGGSAKPSSSRGSRGAGGGAANGNSAGACAAAANGNNGNGSTRGSFGSTQLHDSRGRFMSHAAAQLLATGFTSTPTASGARAGSVGAGDGAFCDTAAAAGDSRGGTPAVSDGPGYSTPRCGTGATGAGDADGNMSDVSSGAPLSEATLGGTTGQPGRAGRCAVCVVQRKGKCGTESAPKKCLRRQLLEQQQAERAKRAAPIHSVAAAASAVAIAAAEAEALAAARGSPALRPSAEPTSATAMSALALAAAEAEALAAACNSPALRVVKQEVPASGAPYAEAAAGAVAVSQPSQLQEEQSQQLSEAQTVAAAAGAVGGVKLGPLSASAAVSEQQQQPELGALQHFAQQHQEGAELLQLQQFPEAAAGMQQLPHLAVAAAAVPAQQSLMHLLAADSPVASSEAAAAAAAAIADAAAVAAAALQQQELAQPC